MLSFSSFRILRAFFFKNTQKLTGLRVGRHQSPSTIAVRRAFSSEKTFFKPPLTLQSKSPLSFLRNNFLRPRSRFQIVIFNLQNSLSLPLQPFRTPTICLTLTKQPFPSRKQVQTSHPETLFALVAAFSRKGKMCCFVFHVFFFVGGV